MRRCCVCAFCTHAKAERCIRNVGLVLSKLAQCIMTFLFMRNQQKTKIEKTAKQMHFTWVFILLHAKNKKEEEINALKRNTNKIAIKIKWWSLSVRLTRYCISCWSNYKTWLIKFKFKLLTKRTTCSLLLLLLLTRTTEIYIRSNDWVICQVCCNASSFCLVSCFSYCICVLLERHTHIWYD